MLWKLPSITHFPVTIFQNNGYGTYSSTSDKLDKCGVWAATHGALLLMMSVNHTSNKATPQPFCFTLGLDTPFLLPLPIWTWQGSHCHPKNPCWAKEKTQFGQLCFSKCWTSALPFQSPGNITTLRGDGWEFGEQQCLVRLKLVVNHRIPSDIVT